MNRAGPYALGFVVVLFAAAMTFVILRGEDTRSIVKKAVNPCREQPRSRDCRVWTATVADALRGQGYVVVKRGELRRIVGPGLRKQPGFLNPSGGGGAGSPPVGGGPIGRVPSPGSPPAPPKPPPPEPRPLIDLDAPVPLETCVAGVVGVNCP